MFPSDDPIDMKPEERFQEMAAILARGFLRLRKHLPCPFQKPLPNSGNLPEIIEDNSDQFPPKSPQNRLDSSAKESVHTTVVNKFRKLEVKNGSGPYPGN